MPATNKSGHLRVHDVLGVGFGPANMALAIAIVEEAGETGSGLSSLFVERKPAFGWHQGLLLEGATMQVSFLKDLATMRNPVSRFGFLSYLHERNRLADFINHKEFYPSRIEFHDYLEWVAAKLAHRVHYGVEVVAIEPLTVAEEIVAFEVMTSGEGKAGNVYRARNLVIGTGLVPRLPRGVAPSARVWHSSELLERMATSTIAVTRFAVVGGGQSAGEVTAYLHEHYPQADVFAVVPRYGYAPADDSAFVNGIFDPGAVDEFFESTPAVRAKFYEYHANANYSVVDLDLIRELHRRVYQESVTGRRRLHLLRMSRVSAIDTDSAGVHLRLDAMIPGALTHLDVDIVVYATGYEPMNPTALLGPIAELCQRDDSGRLEVQRDYRVTTAAHLKAGIYLQGGTEHTHGISSSLLSNVAIRAGEIVRSLACHPRFDLLQDSSPLPRSESREYVRT